MKLFGPEREVVKIRWRKVYNGELRILYPSPNIIRAIKSERIGWVRRVACMVAIRN
jgi:hypothetical protein